MTSEELQGVSLTFKNVGSNAGIINGESFVSEANLKALLIDLDPQLWSDDSTSQLFRSASLSCNGAIRLDEFIQWLACDAQADDIFLVRDSEKQVCENNELVTTALDSETIGEDVRRLVTSELSPEEHTWTLKERCLDAMCGTEKLSALARELFTRVQRAPFGARRKLSAVDAVDFKQLEDFARWFPKELNSGVKLPEGPEFYAMLMAHDSTGHMVLSIDDFVGLLQDLLLRIFRPGTTLTRSQSQTLDPVEPAGTIHVSVVTMDGTSWDIPVDDREAATNFKKLVMSQLSIPVKEQRLVCRGVILQDCLKLHEQGVVDGESLLVIRVIGPPDNIRLVDPSMPNGRATCGMYKRMESATCSDGRPVYHGGDMSLYFAYNQKMERWEFNDTRIWEEYADRCWGFCNSCALHPGSLIDATWHVFGGMENGDTLYTVAPNMKLLVEE